MSNQKALDFLELMVVEEFHRLPADFVADADEIIIQRLEQKKITFVEWMMREPTWMGLIAADLSMDENQVRDCYNNPVAFKDYCHSFLWNYFKVALCDFNFEDEVTSILVRHKFIEKDGEPA